MSKQCPKCGGTNTSKDWYAHDQGICYVCADWCYIGDPEEFKEQTVFDKITANEEVLAEKLVYYEDIMGIIYWFSTVLPRERVFLIKSRAISATVVELKKEYENDLT